MSIAGNFQIVVSRSRRASVPLSWKALSPAVSSTSSWPYQQSLPPSFRLLEPISSPVHKVNNVKSLTISRIDINDWNRDSPNILCKILFSVTFLISPYFPCYQPVYHQSINWGRDITALGGTPTPPISLFCNRWTSFFCENN